MKALAASIKRVSAISSERGRAFKMEIRSAEASVELSVSNPDAGMCADEVACGVEGLPAIKGVRRAAGFAVGMLPTYALNLLDSLGAAKVTFRFCEAQ